MGRELEDVKRELAEREEVVALTKAKNRALALQLAREKGQAASSK
jgi:hypothetical protein